MVARYLLDTNIVSELVKPHPCPVLAPWFADRIPSELCISVLTLAELWRGILQLPRGRRRVQMESWFGGPTGPRQTFAERILPFDEGAGLIWSRLMADGAAAGRPRSPLDMIIAATAEAHQCLVVTANERHFAGLPFINPLAPPPTA